MNNTIWQSDLVLGKATAPMLITVACNPYCGPCAKAHIQLDDFLQRFAGKVTVQVRLLCDAENKTDRRTIAVKAILQKTATTTNNIELQQMLLDWFECMDFKKWNTIWQPDNNINVNERLKEHSKWIENSNIQFTPAFFINGHKLPSRYNLKDLAILLPQLSEILTNEPVK